MDKQRRFSFVLLSFLVSTVDFPRVWSAADPCTSNPCGKGAECHLRSNLAVCICPTGTSGDPFELCVLEGETKTEASTSSSSPSTYRTSTSSSTSHPSTSSYDHGNTANHFRVTYESSDGRTSTPISSYTHFTETSSYPSTTRVAEIHRPESESRDNHNGHLRPYDHRVEYQDSRRNEYGYGPDDESPRNSYDSMRGNNYNSYYDRNHEYNRRPIHGSQVLFETNGDRRTTYESGNFRFETEANLRGQNDRPSTFRDDIFDNNYYAHNGGNSHMDPVRRTGDKGGVLTFPSSSSSHVRDSVLNGETVKDPFGRYKNCIKVRGVVVCADDSDSDTTRTLSHSSSNNHHHVVASPNRHHDSHSSSSHQNQASSSNIFRDDHESRPGHSSVKFSDRSGEPAPSKPKNTYRGQPEGTIYSEVIIRSDDQRPLPVDTAQKSASAASPSDQDCKKFCGVNAVCRSLLGRPVCGCPQGYTGDASVRCVPEEEQERMENRCHKHTDCAKHEICKDSQCINPCAGSPGSSTSASSGSHHRQHRMKRMNHFSEQSRRIGGAGDGDESARKKESSGLCGENTKCEVVGHTPLCGCLDGYTGNPYFGCVPVSSNRN